MAKFGVHCFWHENRFEQPGKNFDGANQHQIAQGAGIGDRCAHANSETESVQCLQLAVQFLQRDAVVNFMRFQEPIDLMTGLDTEQSAEIRLGQAASAVFLGGKCLQRAALEVSAIGAQADGEVVGKGDGQVHRGSLTWEGPRVKINMKKDVIMGDFRETL